MENNVSKAQIEVWEWKEKSYEEIKWIASEDQIKFIKNETKKFTDKLYITKSNKTH